MQCVHVGFRPYPRENLNSVIEDHKVYVTVDH